MSGHSILAHRKLRCDRREELIRDVLVITGHKINWTAVYKGQKKWARRRSSASAMSRHSAGAQRARAIDCGILEMSAPTTAL